MTKAHIVMVLYVFLRYQLNDDLAQESHWQFSSQHSLRKQRVYNAVIIFMFLELFTTMHASLTSVRFCFQTCQKGFKSATKKKL